MKLASSTARLVLTTAVLMAGESAFASPVSVQLVSPTTTAIRVLLDGKLIFDGVPERSSNADSPMQPVLLGSFDSENPNRHSLTVQTASAPFAKASWEWTGRAINSKYVVIRYYPGQGTAEEPPFFTFVLQQSRALNK